MRITASGNLIAYPDKLTTRTTDLTYSKLLRNNRLGTENANCATLDIADFLLGTSFDKYEYMKMPIKISSQHIKEQYDLNNKAYKGCIWLRIRNIIYSLPQDGILANKQLREKLKPHRYYEVHILQDFGNT